MSQLRMEVNPHEVSAAANLAGDAAGQARGQDSSSCLSSLALALPGSQTAADLPALSQDWTTYISYWVQQADAYSAALHEAATTYAASDEEASRYLQGALATIDSVEEPS